MNIKLYSIAAIFFATTHTLFAQQEQDSTYRNIEVVKITKVLPKSQNKQNLETKQSDLLNHDAGKFLNSIPEINGIKKAGNYATDPVLRGFKYEQLNIVIDGAAHAVNACPSRMDPAVSQVNMNMVQEAEIYKGPYHFRYGNSFGGTINFVTLAPEFTENLKLGGRISSGYESNGNVFRNELFSQLSHQKIVWDLFGSYQKGDRYKDGNGDEVRSAFLRYNMGTKGNFKWNDQNVTTLQINTNQGRDVEFAALNMDLIYDKTWMFQLKHLAEFNQKYLKHLDFNSYYSFVDHSMGTPDRKMVSDVQSTTYGARLESKFAFGKNIFYTGLDYKHEGAENIRMIMPAMMPMRDGTSWQDSSIDQIGWFNEYQFNFKNSKLVASLRLDYNKGDAKALSNLFKTLYGDGKAENFNHSLSLGYNKNLCNHNQLGIWLGRAQRSGSLTERYINRFAVGIDAYELVGNPDLKPETSKNLELGTYFTNNSNFDFNITGFFSEIEDKIMTGNAELRCNTDTNKQQCEDYMLSVGTPWTMDYNRGAPDTWNVTRPINAEEAEVYGIETGLNWEFAENWKLGLNYTWTETEIKDKQLNNPVLNDTPKHMANASLKWQAADFVNLWARGEYRSERARFTSNYENLTVANQAVYDALGDYKAYTLFHIGSNFIVNDKDRKSVV